MGLFDDDTEATPKNGSSDTVIVAAFVEVELPSGATFEVATAREAEFVLHSTAEYLEAYDFQTIGDLRDLDAIVRSELMVYRWDQWVSWRHDYENQPINDQQLMSRVKDRIDQLGKQRASLGIDKVTREKTRGEGSPAKYLANLLVRARHFGLHRLRQLDLALELLNHIFGMATFWRNADPEERRSMHMTADDILETILDRHLPEWQELDSYFMTHDQTTWIEEM